MKTARIQEHDTSISDLTFSSSINYGWKKLRHKSARLEFRKGLIQASETSMIDMIKIVNQIVNNRETYSLLK